MQSFALRGRHNMKHYSWVAPRESIDNGRNKAGSQKWIAPNSEFSSGRVREEFDVLYALAKIIKYGHSTVEQRATKRGRLDSVAVPIEQTHAERVLQVRD